MNGPREYNGKQNNTVKDKYHMVSFTCLKNKTKKQRGKRKREREKERKRERERNQETDS